MFRPHALRPEIYKYYNAVFTATDYLILMSIV